jgi:hypothetical protein
MLPRQSAHFSRSEIITTMKAGCNRKWAGFAGCIDGTRAERNSKAGRSECEPVSKGAEMERDYTPYQQKIIKRYYDNQGAIQQQRLAELVSELYLSEGKKRQRVWKTIASALEKLGYSKQRIEHLMKQDNPALLAELVKELEKKK